MGPTATTHADAMLETIASHSETFSAHTELRLHNNYSSNISMKKGTIIQNTSSKIGGISARCFSGGYFGFSSTPSLDSESIKKVISEAEFNAKLFGKKENTQSHQLPKSEIGSGIYDYRSTKESRSASERVDFIKDLNSYIEKNFKDLLSWDLGLTHLALEKALITSEGAHTYSYIPRANILANFSAESSDGIVSLYQAFGGFGDLEDNLDSPELYYPQIEKLYQDIRLKAEGVYPTGGYKDVILDSDLAGILAHEAIGHTVEGDAVMTGSVAGDYLNQEVASELFTLIDGPERGPDGKASIAIHVDDEGTKCQETVLIKDGVLKSFLHNKETARHFGVEPTGNARAYQFFDEPLVRMRNTYIQPGNSKLDDMIASVDDGYYLIRSSNGQADKTSEFMFGVIQGFEIKNGKLGKAIKDTTVSGVAFDMLKTVTAVSDDLTWARGGMCGKKQWIPVGMGGPAVKCKIHLGGR